LKRMLFLRMLIVEVPPSPVESFRRRRSWPPVSVDALICGLVALNVVPVS